jgi:hypothetical protein
MGFSAVASAALDALEGALAGALLDRAVAAGSSPAMGLARYRHARLGSTPDDRWLAVDVSFSSS